MLSVIDKLKKKQPLKNQASEWSKSGSFMNKPQRGWIHLDSQLKPDAGVCYGVRYIGCLEVKESMKSLDFDTRTQLAREAITRVSEAAGLKNASKKRKADKKINRMLGIHPGMQYAGSNVNLTITTDCLSLMIMESGETITVHQMTGISFASGGDSETLDFVAYVAKDASNNRACHVLECGGGLAEDVITTVGQAFELRFKEYLKRQPKAVAVPDRLENPISDGDAWGDDEDGDYYNDRPGAAPPEPMFSIPAEYAIPSCNLPISDGVYSSVKDKPMENNIYDTAKETTLIDLDNPVDSNVYDNPPVTHKLKAEDINFMDGNVYDNKENVDVSTNVYDNKPPQIIDNTYNNNNLLDMDNIDSRQSFFNCYDNSEARRVNIDTSVSDMESEHRVLDVATSNTESQSSHMKREISRGKDSAMSVDNGTLDPFDMEPFNMTLHPKQTDDGIETFARIDSQSDTCHTLPRDPNLPPGMTAASGNIAPLFDEWYHGQLSRKDAEKLLIQDGDFLVRQSSNDSNQFVLSGRQNSHIKHLLLVDPEGVVRTKDHSFESVPHLIHYHQDEGLPIISQESEIYLLRSVSNKYTNC